MKPENVTLIESIAPDRRHLLDLERQYTTAKEKAELAHTQLAEISMADAELSTRMFVLALPEITKPSRDAQPRSVIARPVPFDLPIVFVTAISEKRPVELFATSIPTTWFLSMLAFIVWI